eukprot:227585-Prymnesium_polylepis.1
MRNQSVRAESKSLECRATAIFVALRALALRAALPRFDGPPRSAQSLSGVHAPRSADATLPQVPA